MAGGPFLLTFPQCGMWERGQLDPHSSSPPCCNSVLFLGRIFLPLSSNTEMLGRGKKSRLRLECSMWAGCHSAFWARAPAPPHLCFSHDQRGRDKVCALIPLVRSIFSWLLGPQWEFGGKGRNEIWPAWTREAVSFLCNEWGRSGAVLPLWVCANAMSSWQVSEASASCLLPPRSSSVT